MKWKLFSMFIPLTGSVKRICTCTVTRAAVGLSYKIIGNSDGVGPEPPLILLHGLLGSKKEWKSLGKTMLNMTKRTVVVVDQRNHGNSPHVNSHTYVEMAEDVLRLLEKLNVQKACLIGHSMGGKTCMCVSLMAPEKIAGLLVLEISPISSPSYLTEYFPKVLAAMKNVDFKNPKSIRMARTEAKRQLKALITDDVLMRSVLDNIRVKPQGVIGWKVNLDSLIKNIGHITSFPTTMKGKRYRGPTLFIGGQMSDFIPPDDLTQIRDFFPYAVVHYVPDAGHYLHVEQPKAFLEYVIAFSKNMQ